MTSEQINAEGCDQAPIHSLPDEILEVIFLIHASELVKDGHYDRTLATAQVCQRWRAVALDYPIIWSRIIDYENHSPLWIETLLARSGSTLIDVGRDSTVKLQYPRATPVLKSIFKRNTNLKTVNLWLQRGSLEPICRSFLRHPAPNLEFLFLMTSRTYPDCLNSNPLFANEAPCLRRLHLQRCLIDLTSSVLSNLTELSVLDVSKAGLSIAEWLRVLKNIPALRSLALRKAISHLTEHEQPLPVVDLPHLALLTISTEFYLGISLIDHLNIPALCGIELWLYRPIGFTGAHHVNWDGTKLLFFLSKQLIHWPQNCYDRFLLAKVHGGGEIHFGNSKRAGQVSYYKTESDVVEESSRHSKDPLLLLVLTLNSLDDSFGFFNQLLEMYNSTFPTTTTLDLWLDQGFVAATTNGSFPAFHTFNSFSNVKTLILLGRSPLYLLPLFQHSSHPLFPALQSLHLTETNMEDEWGVMRDAFIKFLLWRAESGIPLTEIKMLGGYMSHQTAEDLSRIGDLQVVSDQMSEG